MKRTILLLLFNCLLLPVFSQPVVFEKQANGLFLSDKTIEHFRPIVDSINQAFEISAQAANALSKWQTVAHFVHLGKRNKKAIADISAQIPFNELTEKYPQLKIEPYCIVYQIQPESGDYIFLKTISFGKTPFSRLPYLKLSKKELVEKGKGHFFYDEKEFAAIYLVEKFDQKPIPKVIREKTAYKEFYLTKEKRLYLNSTR